MTPVRKEPEVVQKEEPVAESPKPEIPPLGKKEGYMRFLLYGFIVAALIYRWFKSKSKPLVKVSTRKRPISVTVIAWFEILTSGDMLFKMLYYAKSEFRQLVEASGRSVTISVLWGIVGGVITLVSGIAMLKGLNWGRWLCLCYGAISIVLTLLLYGFYAPKFLIGGIAIYIVQLVFLTRPAVSTFFTCGSSEKQDVEG